MYEPGPVDGGSGTFKVGAERRGQISQARSNADAVRAPSFAVRRRRGQRRQANGEKSIPESLGCFETEIENFHEMDLQPSFSLVGFSSAAVLINSLNFQRPLID